MKRQTGRRLITNRVLNLLMILVFFVALTFTSGCGHHRHGGHGCDMKKSGCCAEKTKKCSEKEKKDCAEKKKKCADNKKDCAKKCCCKDCSTKACCPECKKCKMTGCGSGAAPADAK